MGKVKEPLENMYKGGFFKNRHKLNWRAEHFCRAVIATFDPKDVIDVGCATGDLVACFNDMGLIAFGIEGSGNAKPFLETGYIWFHDLREPIKPSITFDLVMSLEVAEHIEPEYAEIYVANLVTLGDRILITAAPPGQGGHHHFNCQLPEYWDEKFKAHNYLQIPFLTQMLKNQLVPWKHKPGIKAFYDNAIYYERRPKV